MPVKPAIEVDLRGLEKILSRRGKEFAVLELVQNALDEDTKQVAVSLEQTPASRGYYTLSVEDDSPNGFVDLSHAYTLFAESAKKANPEQRGRFNVGEKLVIACCRKATLVTTTGAIQWEHDKRRHLRRRRPSGSVFTGEIKMTHAEAQKSLEAVARILAPGRATLSMNGVRIDPRTPLRTITETLPTEIADSEGYLRPTRRQTEIHIHDLRDGEEAWLYEMGIPVVPLECPWHLDVQQKVPLNLDRDNVTPSYLRMLRAYAANAMADQLSTEEASGAWVDDALESKHLDENTVEAVMTARYGPKRVIRDASDPEANALAMTKGYSIIEGGSYSKGAWENIKSSGAALPAGKVTPSPKPFSPDGKPLKTIPPKTPGMHRFVRLVNIIAREILDTPVSVSFANDPHWRFAAAYGHGELTVNYRRLGRRFFDEDPGERQLALLIHEFGHHFASNHLSEDYYDALCSIGAKLATRWETIRAQLD